MGVNVIGYLDIVYYDNFGTHMSIKSVSLRVCFFPSMVFFWSLLELHFCFIFPKMANSVVVVVFFFPTEFLALI